MDKFIIVIISVIVIVAGILVAIGSQEQTNEKDMMNATNERMNLSGDFRIDKSSYNIGEKIFLDMNFDTKDKGVAYILRPINDTHRATYLAIPFNGENKESFSYYFETKLDETKGICSTDDLVGIWSIVFHQTNYPNIEFEVKNQISDWDDRNFDPIC